MNKGSFYVLSNGCMDIYPDNVRTRYSNTLTKQINIPLVESNSLWLALESITVEQSIIQYKDSDVTHDILILENDNTTKYFSIPEICFENESTFLNFFISKCVPSFFSSIRMVNGYISFQTNGSYTLMSSKLYRFLGFTNPKNLIKLGTNWIDNRLTQYNGKYYIIDYFAGKNVMTADQPFELNIFTPNLLKIISPNIKHYICGGGYTNILAIVPLKHTASAVTFNPSIKKYFMTSSDFITSISVKLVDEYNLPINFTIGPPTIVKLRYKEMMNKDTHFYVQIANNDSLDVFPHNTHSYFKSKLPKTLNLVGKWKIALTSIYIPPKIKNISNPTNTLEIIKIIHNLESEGNKVVHTSKIKIPSKRYTSIEELLNLMNKHTLESGIQFGYKEGKVYFLVETPPKNTDYTLKLHSKLACILGYPKEKLRYEINEYIMIPFSSVKEKLEDGQIYYFENVPNLEFSIPPWLILYCDIVTPTTFGHSSIPLLKIIPIENKDIHNLSGHFYDFVNFEYFPVQGDSIQILTFQLRSHDGHLVEFVGDGNVQLTLSFKKSI